MKIEDARTGIGRTVIYGDELGPEGRGVIRSVGAFMVFVNYGSQKYAIPTSPHDLRFDAELKIKDVGWKPTGADPAAPQTEFYREPAGPELGDPTQDPPFTIRMQPPYTRERAYDSQTPRVLKVDRAHDGGHPWVQVTGHGAPLFWTDDHVRDWPLQHHLVAGVAVSDSRKKTETVSASMLEGDMDVEAFKG